jgi:alpha-tubulin suppressor-like RCC1 family protein
MNEFALVAPAPRRVGSMRVRRAWCCSKSRRALWWSLTAATVLASVLVLSPRAQAATAPIVTNVQPNAGSPSGGTVVAITGTNLAGARAVRFGPSAARFTVDSATAIRAVAPAGTGSVDVTVTARGATNASGPADRFSYRQGTALAWGSNNLGELGNPSVTASAVPTLVAGSPEATSIAAGGAHALALLADGRVVAWGDNESGQLGNGTEEGPEKCRDEEACSRVPVEVPGLNGVTAIAAGGIHSLALLGDGKVMSWGIIHLGEEATLVPTEVPGLRDVVAIAAGEESNLALLKNGKVMAWGGNLWGELGDGSFANSAAPVEVRGLREVTSISEGTHLGLALRRNGTVEAWGLGDYGELGNGTTIGSLMPEKVPGLSQVTAVAAGFGHALALRSDGTVMAWGWNASGQLGDGTDRGPDSCEEEACSTSPIAVTGLSEVTAIAAGTASRSSLALLRTGTIEAWGNNLFGQIGAGNVESESCTGEFAVGGPCITSPVEVKEARGVTTIAGSIFFSVANGAL